MINGQPVGRMRHDEGNKRTGMHLVMVPDPLFLFGAIPSYSPDSRVITWVWTVNDVALGKELLAGVVTHITIDRVQDFMPETESLEAAKDEYILNEGESVTMTAKAKTLAGEAVERGASYSHQRCRACDGERQQCNRTVARNGSGRSAYVYGQSGGYIVSRVVTIQVKASASEHGQEETPTPGEEPPSKPGDVSNLPPGRIDLPDRRRRIS